jgi:hypothetical protein
VADRLILTMEAENQSTCHPYQLADPSQLATLAPAAPHTNEGFGEDLARQITVAYLSQLQLRFRRRYIWVSVITVVS